jgi:hypothetical protein
MAGHGSPKGVRQGGRQKGTPNRATAAKAAAIAKSGQTPLDYMLEVMRDKKAEPTLRFNAAKGAAPYVHPSLSSVDMALTGNVTLGGVRPDDVEGQCPPP